VSIVVTPVNDAPVAQPDAKSTPEDVPVSGQVSSTDVDGPAPTYAKLTGPAFGSLVFNANGSWTYTPNANYSGPDSFTFQASDGQLQSNVATVTLDVTPVNDAPVAQPDSKSTPEDTPVSGQVSSTDVDGPAPIYTKATNPAFGSVVFNANGSYTYTPNANYSGPDSFTFYASDGQAQSNVATVSLVVTPVNDAPVAQPDSKTTPEDTPVSGQVSSTDIDGGAPSYTKVAGPAFGSAVLNPDGSYTYTPNPNYNGPDSFTFYASDGQAQSNVATVSIVVTPVNDAPFAQPDSKVTPEDTPVSGQVTVIDVDGGPPAFTLVAQPVFGSVVLNPNGTYTYTPNANYVGADSFTYSAFDGLAVSNVATASIQVTPVNDAPVGVNDQLTIDEDTSGSGNVLDNDVDIDTPHSGLSAYFPMVTTPPVHGTATLQLDGSFSYTPYSDYHGSDSFTYVVTDGQLESAPTTVAIIVQPTNDPPSAGDNYADTTEDTPVSGNVLPNDSDIDGDVLTTALVSGVSHGTLAFGANGAFTYTPNSNYYGPDSFTYKANDGSLNSNVATVNIAVASVNDSPVCTAVVPNVSSIWPPNHQLVTVTLSGATDLEGDMLTYLVTGIFQDELTNAEGDGNTAIDGFGVGTSQATIRAERIGTPQAPGDGRVYHIRYRVTDPFGGSCASEVKVGVPHDQSPERINPVDGGAVYDSTVANPPVTGKKK